MTNPEDKTVEREGPNAVDGLEVDDSEGRELEIFREEDKELEPDLELISLRPFLSLSCKWRRV